MARVTHVLIAKIAKEMAHEFYENAAHYNEFYKMWPNVKVFVVRNHKNFVRAARTSLAKMLAMDYPEEVKEQIMEALFQDRALPAGEVGTGAAIARPN